MKTIATWSQVPRFDSEEEEAAFWMVFARHVRAMGR